MRIAVYGGAGNLGRTIVSRFKAESVTCIDFKANSDAASNIVLGRSDFLANAADVSGQLATILGGEKLDAIFTVAGGWAGGNVADADFLANVDLMYRQSVQVNVDLM